MKYIALNMNFISVFIVFLLAGCGGGTVASTDATTPTTITGIQTTTAISTVTATGNE